MDILVEVPDSKVEFFLELMKNLKFKAEPKPKAKPKKNQLVASDKFDFPS